MTDVTATFADLGNIFQLIKNEAEDANTRAMEDLRDVLAAALDDGLLIQSDTRALALSLYVQTTGRNDYDQALAAARAAFFDNPSRHRGAPASESARANFEAIIADREELPDAPSNVIIAAVSTMLSYGNVWELRDEDGRPWMSPTMWEWATTKMASFYESIRL